MDCVPEPDIEAMLATFGYPFGHSGHDSWLLASVKVSGVSANYAAMTSGRVVEPTVTVIPSLYSGAVIDGYVEGATVFADITWRRFV